MDLILSKGTANLLKAFLLLFLSVNIAYGGDTPCSSTVLPNDMLDFQQFTLDGLSDSGIPSPECGDYTGPDIWFEVICPPSGRLTIVTLAGVTIDAAMAIYSGDCLSLEEILCVEDDICNNSIMPIQDIFDLIPGETYFIRIWPQNGSPEGTFEIRVSDGPPPNILFELVNNATYIDVDGDDCIRLTTEGAGQSGCAWDPDQYDFNQPFDVSISYNFGDLDGNGADGICIVFQDSPAGINACGLTGENIGAGGITNSFIIEFDTWQNGNLGDPVADHVAIQINGNMGSNVNGPISLPNIEDGNYHTMSFTWDPTTQFYEVFFDGVSQLTGNYDIINNCFGGSNLAYYGFTASTGGAVNTHIVCPHPNYPSGNEQEDEVEICEGDSYYAGGSLQTTSGTYTDVYSAYNNCDSIVHTILTVVPSYEENIDTIICADNCVEVGGQVFCETGEYEVILIGGSSEGCDSIIYLNLEVFDPVAIVLPPDLLNCENTFVILDAGFSSTGDDISYSWTGPDNFFSTEQFPTVTEPGIYTLIVIQSEGDIICLSNTFPIEVFQNIEMPIADAGPDMSITCDSASVLLDGSNSSTGSDVNIQWAGPMGYTSNELNPEVSEPGQYTLTLFHEISLCMDIDVVVVDIQVDTPQIQASDGIFSCLTDSLQIFATSNQTLTYQWIGPGNFTSDQQNPFIFLPGEYTVVAIDSNGCEAIDTSIVDSDEDAPELELIGDTLTCIDIQGQLTTLSSEPDLEYDWTGPGNFTSNDQNPVITEDGTYQLFATAPNGCISNAEVDVIGDYNSPEVQTIGDTISCNENEVQIYASTTTQNALFNWTGPGGFTSAEQNPLVFTNGFYYLEVVGPNGCSTLDTVEVAADSDAPQLIMDADTMNCINSEFYISVSSNIQDVIYQWTGPSGFSSDLSVEEVFEAGIYSVTVTSQNGCTSLGEIEVIIDQDDPIVSFDLDTIDCLTPGTVIETDAGNSLYQYQWMGPSGFNSADQSPAVSMPGSYSVEIVGSNGCSIVEDIEVIGDLEAPIVTVSSDEINCLSNQFFLHAISSEQNLIYMWSGPSGFNSNLPEPEIYQPGDYNIVVTAPNGCFYEETVTVTQNIQLPELSLENGSIDCNNPELIVLPSGDISGLTLEWVGTDGTITSGSPSISVDQGGTIYLTSTGTNGCSSIDSATIISDFSVATIDLVISEDIDCQNNGITITSNITGNIDVLSWTGPSSFVYDGINPFVTEAGIYNLVVTTENGCQSTSSVEVLSVQDNPELTLSDMTLTCIDTQAIVSPITNIQDGDFLWSGPQGFVSSNEVINIQLPGVYMLVLTNPQNNCKAIDSLVLVDDRIYPDITASSDTLTCNNPIVDLICDPFHPDYTYTWSGPSGFSSNDQNTSNDLPGTYTIYVKNLTNGCISDQEINVLEIPGPETMILNVFQPDCEGLVGSLEIPVVIGGVAPYQFSINGLEFQNNPEFFNLVSGDYSLVIKDKNECLLDTSFSIIESVPLEVILEDQFVISIGENQQLLPQLNIPFSEVQSILWEPSDFLSCSDCLEPVASPPQSTNYTVIINDYRGCTASASVNIRVKQAELFTPNVFSPNGDGVNDYFTIFGNPNQVESIVNLHIFDRWGNMVFTGENLPLNDESKGWDGRIREIPANPAVYVFLASILLSNGEQILLKGSITLIQ